MLIAGAAIVATFAIALRGGDGDGSLATVRSGTLREEFDGRRLNRRVWSTCHWWARPRRGCTIASNNELEWYLPGQVRVRRGKLRLVAQPRPARGDEGRVYPYRSGMISTGPPYDSRRAKFAFTYGRAEIRARTVRGRGLWPAFWLLSADRSSKPEIDVVEMYGHEPETVRMNLHWRDAEGESQQAGKRWSSPRMRSGWHRFAIDWRPGRLVWLVDGVERWRVEGDTVPSTPMYLLLNLAVGGDRPGPPSDETKFPATFEVDYVRVTR